MIIHCSGCGVEVEIPDELVGDVDPDEWNSRTYQRLGKENPEDITVLCRDCHKLFETNKKAVTA